MPQLLFAWFCYRKPRFYPALLGMATCVFFRRLLTGEFAGYRKLGAMLEEATQHTQDELLPVRNFGETTLDQVRERLGGIDLRLGMRLPNQQLK